MRRRSSDFPHALTYEIERIAADTSQFLSLIASSIILAVYMIFTLQLSGLITGFIFFVGLVLLLLLRNRTQSEALVVRNYLKPVNTCISPPSSRWKV